MTMADAMMRWPEMTTMMTKMMRMVMVMCVVAVSVSVVDSIETDLPPPSVTVSKVPGQDAVLECDVPDINTRNVGWYKDGQPVSQHGSRFVISKKTGDLILFVEALSDEGNYTCYAAKGPKFDPYTVFLSVSLLPTVSVVSLNPVKPMEQGQIRIVCSSYGKPRPQFEWFSSQEKRVWPQTSSTPMDRMSVQERHLDELTIETSLLVSPVTSQDRGLFKCIATNKVGSSREEISVDVQFTPKMLTSNETRRVHWWEGRRANLTCQAKGNPAPVIIWSPPDVITPVVTVSDGIVMTSTLWFSEKSSFNFPASFECHAENRYGETDSRHFTIKQVYAPPAPQVAIISIQDDIMQLSITVPKQKATPQPTYVTVDYQRQNSTRWITAGTAFEGNGTVLTLLGILLGHSYVVKVKVNNRVGYSNTTVLNVLADEFPVPEESTTPKPTQRPSSDIDSQPSNNNNNNNNDDSSNNNDNNETDNGDSANIGKSVDGDGRISSLYIDDGSKTTRISCLPWLLAVLIAITLSFSHLLSS